MTFVPTNISELVFVGFNSRVLALCRKTGDVAWSWRAPKGTSQYVATMLDGDILIVSVSGYMFGVDPLTGQTIWQNPLSGTGFGIPSLCSVRSSNSTSGGPAGAFNDHHAAQAAMV